MLILRTHRRHLISLIKLFPFSVNSVVVTLVFFLTFVSLR